MSYFRQLFPPILPSSAAAYNGEKALRVYFKMSVANSRDQFQHAQITIHRLNSNQNALDKNTYPLGIIFIPNNQMLYDSNVKMYYIDLPANLLALDEYYKLQIRLGAQTIAGVNIDYLWINNPVEVQKFSEWSNVCIIKPISIPTFGLVGFSSKDSNGKYIEPVYESENLINIANTPGFLFVGSYTPSGEETLSSYEMILYEDNGTIVESSWNKISESGPLYIGEYELTNIKHSFDYTLERGKTYFVEFKIKTKNGYIESKFYKVLVMYADIVLYNAFVATSNEEAAKVSLEVRGKQILFEAASGTIIEPIRDSSTAPAEILDTHMIIKGTVFESESTNIYTIDGKWIAQFKAMGIAPKATRKDAILNPFLTISEKPGIGPYYHKIKLCAVKQNVTFPRETSQRWISEFILIKEVYTSRGSLVFSQKYRQALDIDYMKEYYFFIKEDNGYLNFSASLVRTSTNAELKNSK